MDDIILYDWLSFSAKWEDPYRMTALLGLSGLPWQHIKGARGYQERLYFNAISIHYNGRGDMGVWCEMSGQGCRAFETLSTLEGDKWQALFQVIFQQGLNITRLDVAYDDHTGTLDIDQIIQDVRQREYISCMKYWEIIESSKGKTVQIGSPQSDTLIRIYDKARERNCPDGEHWIRCELQLRRDRAVAFAQLPQTIGEAYCGVVMNYLRFVEPMEGDTNRWRWPLKAYWADFLCNANAIGIYRSPGLEYNLDRCKRYVIRQAGNAIDAFIQIVGLPTFLNELYSRSVRRNPKYDRLVAEHKTLQNSPDQGFLTPPPGEGGSL